MANPEHLKKLKEGVEAWNAWRAESDETPDLSEADLRGAKLAGVNLRGAKLMKANLRWASLRDADFRMADLSRADLMEVDFKDANLRAANLTKSYLTEADLRDADLSDAKLIMVNIAGANLFGTTLNRADLTESALDWSSLINADLSYANISGAELTGANMHNWIIKGIKCTHITWNNKEIHYDNPDDFEKAFTQIENAVEILLDLPFSDLTYYTGRIIEHEINQKYGKGALRFKGQTAISDNTTQSEFISFSTPDEVQKIRDELSELNNKLNPVIEQAKSKEDPQSPIGLKSEIDIPGSGGSFVLRPNEIKRILTERHARLHPLLQNIISTIQLHIR